MICQFSCLLLPKFKLREIGIRIPIKKMGYRFQNAVINEIFVCIPISICFDTIFEASPAESFTILFKAHHCFAALKRDSKSIKGWELGELFIPPDSQIMKFLIAIFALSCIAAAQAELSSGEVLAMLRLMQQSMLAVEEEVAMVPSMIDKMDDRTITNKEFENHLVDATRIVSNSLWLVTGEKNKVLPILGWIVDRISSSVCMIAPLREARSYIFGVAMALGQMASSETEEMTSVEAPLATWSTILFSRTLALPPKSRTASGLIRHISTPVSISADNVFPLIVNGTCSRAFFAHFTCNALES